jgi:photosystem II stability/assembly factor-like uncharacterized protein
MKKGSYFIVVLVIFCFGCKKDKKQNPGNDQSDLKIELIQGNNQKDTIGNLLQDTIKVKVTKSGAPVANYIVQFKRSGCGDVNITEQTTSASGQASYTWYLSGEAGGQLLDIIVLDNNRNKKDSISATAIGIVATQGWHRSGCVQNFPVNAISELNSGRLLASLNTLDYPYYSDDNAISWHPLKTFSKNYFISKIISDTQNDIFLATRNDGLFYSKDGGQTWANRSSGIADPTGFADMAYTHGGQLIFTDNSGVYISNDKGLTWINESLGLPSGQSFYPCEQLNGDLYIIGSDDEVYKLTNGGSTWVNQGTNLGNNLLASVASIFIDDNGDMYIGNPHNGIGANGNIYKSTDGGKTWNMLFSQTTVGSSYPNVTQISKQNGNYYFSFAGLGVYKTANFSTYSNITSKFASYGLLSYTISKNSTFVIGSPGFGIFYYIP